MSQRFVLSPTDLDIIAECTLKFSLLKQWLPSQGGDLAYSDRASIEAVARETLDRLHAGGGPYRLNLPATLRVLDQLLPEAYRDDVALKRTLRQMVANYHRRLKRDWSGVIASNELMTLTIRLPRGAVRVEAAIDRVDREQDGGITTVKFVISADPIPEHSLEEDIETTALHALGAAAYPHHRPVRVKYLWLHQNQEDIVELTEKQYRRNLEIMKARLQAWQEGEVMARPGSHCDECPFKYDGCPVYANDLPPDAVPAADNEAHNLPPARPPATLSFRNSQHVEESNFAETDSDP